MGRSAVVALVVGAAAALSACSAGEGTFPTSTTAATTTVAPTTTLSPEQSVLAAYRAYWDTWLAANDPPDPDHPGLARHYTGVALDRARASIAENQANGVVLRLPPGSRYRHDAAIRSITGDVAILDDCAVDDGQVILAIDGTILDDRVVTNRSQVTLQRVDDEWRVLDVQVQERWEGIAGCAGF